MFKCNLIQRSASTLEMIKKLHFWVENLPCMRGVRVWRHSVYIGFDDEEGLQYIMQMSGSHLVIITPCAQYLLHVGQDVSSARVRAVMTALRRMAVSFDHKVVYYGFGGDPYWDEACAECIEPWLPPGMVRTYDRCDQLTRNPHRILSSAYYSHEDSNLSLKFTKPHLYRKEDVLLTIPNDILMPETPESVIKDLELQRFCEEHQDKLFNAVNLYFKYLSSYTLEDFLELRERTHDKFEVTKEKIC